MRSRRFRLMRHEDVSGVSGTGPVAEGVQFTDGAVALRWYGDYPTTTVWDGIDSVVAIHGHGGATEVEWLDPDQGRTRRSRGGRTCRRSRGPSCIRHRSPRTKGGS